MYDLSLAQLDLTELNRVRLSVASSRQRRCCDLIMTSDNEVQRCSAGDLSTCITKVASTYCDCQTDHRVDRRSDDQSCVFGPTDRINLFVRRSQHLDTILTIDPTGLADSHQDRAGSVSMTVGPTVGPTVRIVSTRNDRRTNRLEQSIGPTVRVRRHYFDRRTITVCERHLMQRVMRSRMCA